MIFIQLAVTAILVVISANLYRLGGKYATIIRDGGCSICIAVTAGLWSGWHWSLIIVWGHAWGGLTTYWKKKGTDARWYNWLIHGLFIGGSTIWYTMFFTHNWVGLIICTLISGIGMMLVSIRSGKDWFEEKGRGGMAIVATALYRLGALWR